MSPLRWTCKSTRRLATELTGQGHRVGYRTVARLLHEAGYSLQANRKTREGNQHPDRNAQFEFINAQAARFQKRRQPVISVDTKKKELGVIPSGKSAPLLSFCQALADGVLVRSSLFEIGDKPV